MAQALRFVTARDLFEAYPIALDELYVEPTDQPSLEFLKALVDSNALGKAVVFVVMSNTPLSAPIVGQCARSDGLPGRCFPHIKKPFVPARDERHDLPRYHSD